MMMMTMLATLRMKINFLPAEYLKFGTVGNVQRPDIVLANSNAAQRPMYVTTTIIIVLIIVTTIIIIIVIILTDIVMFVVML